MEQSIHCPPHKHISLNALLNSVSSTFIIHAKLSGNCNLLTFRTYSMCAIDYQVCSKWEVRATYPLMHFRVTGLQWGWCIFVRVALANKARVQSTSIMQSSVGMCTGETGTGFWWMGLAPSWDSIRKMKIANNRMSLFTVGWRCFVWSSAIPTCQRSCI